MRNPADLYRWETDALIERRPGVLIVALGGFMDAGNVQGILSNHLIDSGDPEVLATFDVDQVLDYRGRRPTMVFDTNHWASYDDPAMILYRLHDRDGATYYILTGPEPDYQWERMVVAVRQIMDRLGISLIVTTHGIPMAVPHTRPIGMTAHSTDPSLIGDAVSPFGTVQVPASFSSLLELRVGEHGADALGFAVHVPHYLAQSDWAEGALAALTKITDVTSLNLPNDDLVAAAGVGTAQIANEVAGNEEVGQVVHALEQQYDAFMRGQQTSLLATQAQELPSADEIAADFEDFLRSVSDEDEPDDDAQGRLL